MYCVTAAFGSLNTKVGVVHVAPLLVERAKATAAPDPCGMPGVRNFSHTAYSVPSTGSAPTLSCGDHRKPLGLVALNATDSPRVSVAMVPVTGNVAPPSVERAQ